MPKDLDAAELLKKPTSQLTMHEIDRIKAALAESQVSHRYTTAANIN